MKQTGELCKTPDADSLQRNFSGGNRVIFLVMLGVSPITGHFPLADFSLSLNEPNKALAAEGYIAAVREGERSWRWQCQNKGVQPFWLSQTVVAGALMGGSAQASVIESSPSFPPIPLSFVSPTGAGCFDIAAVCVTPGTFVLTSAKSNFLLPAVQDVVADATYTGSLTPLPPGTGSLGY